MSATGDSAVTAQPDGIYVPITTSLLFCINLRHPAELGNSRTWCEWLCVDQVYFGAVFNGWIFVHSCSNFYYKTCLLLLEILIPPPWLYSNFKPTVTVLLSESYYLLKLGTD